MRSRLRDWLIRRKKSMKPVKFTYYGTAVPKARARSFGGRHYTPKKTVEYEKHIAKCGMVAMVGRRKLSEAVGMSARIYLPVPVSWSKNRRALALNGELHPVTKPDLSNILKSIEDALNKVVYHDDAQIVEYGKCGKYYSDIPRVEVEVYPVD